MTMIKEFRSTTVETMSDLLESLGGISPARVRLHPSPGSATEQDVLDIDAREGRHFELVDDTLVEKAMGFWESMLAIAIASALRAFVIPRKLGVVTGSDGMVRLFPQLRLIRMPDVAFVSNARLPAPGSPRRPVPQLAPDLAVEVLSEGNTAAEMERKRSEYFGAGVRLVWIVDPVTRTIDVYTGIAELVTVREGQTLDGGTVLPGFGLVVTELFSELDPYPR
jgi:Uma2 family endonuclease